MRKTTILVFGILLAFGAANVSARSEKPVDKGAAPAGKLTPPAGAGSPVPAGDAKKPAKPSKPWSKMSGSEKRDSFTDTYNQKKGVGGKEFSDFKSSVIQGDDSKEAQEKIDMFNNLEKGKTAGGNSKSAKQRREDKAAQEKAKADYEKAKEEAKPKGFMGDPTDPGPTDWSGYDIKTDKDGNVIGFAPKEDALRDADGDGVVSEQEARDYEMGKAEGYMDTDGDGEVSNDEKKAAAKEMDTDGDGQVSEEELEKWNDKKDAEKEKEENDKFGGAPGEVPPIADWDKDGDGKPDDDWMLACWQCVPDDSIVDPNECHGGRPGKCACSGNEVCSDEWQEGEGELAYWCHECEEKDKDSTPWCVEKGYFVDPACGGSCKEGPCVPVTVNKDTGKVIGDKATRERGKTAQCYACMKVTSIEIEYIVIIYEFPWGRVILKDSQGDAFKPESILAFANPKNLGDLANEMKAAKASLNDLSGALAEGLMDKRNPFNENCFNGLLDQFNPAQFMPQIPPISFGKKGNLPSSQMKGASGSPFGKDPLSKVKNMMGPVLACGTKDGEKQLSVFDAAGRLIEKVTPEGFEADPNIITNALAKAESFSQQFLDMKAKGIKGMAADFATKMAGKTQSMIMDKMMPPKDKKEMVPNDPLYIEQEEKKKGFFGSNKRPPKKINVGAAMRRGDSIVGTGEKVQKGPEVHDQWGLRHIGYTPLSDPDSAWHVVDGSGENIIVAVVDSGLDMSHPDGPEYVWTNPGEIPGNGIDDDANGYIDDIHGWNFQDNNNDLTDLKGHGTFVAGIIAAKRNNGIGVSGINPGAVIMPLKVTNKDGETNSLNIFRAIHYAVSKGARVINLSLGGRGISKAEQIGLNHAHEAGVFVAVASGNTGEYLGDIGPASAANSFTVGSVDVDGRRSTISSVGPNNGVMGPGELIYSIQSQDAPREGGHYEGDKNYHKMSGTSFSTPMIAATASLMLILNPALTPDQITDIILGTAQDMKTEGWDDETGGGTLDAAAALRAVDQEFLTVVLNNLRINKNPDKRDRIESVDVFATVRGDFKEFYVEVGRGKDATKFSPVAGPFEEQANFDWVTRLDKKAVFKSIDEWTIQVRAIDKNGKEKVARALLMVE